MVAGGFGFDIIASCWLLRLSGLGLASGDKVEEVTMYNSAGKKDEQGGKTRGICDPGQKRQSREGP